MVQTCVVHLTPQNIGGDRNSPRHPAHSPSPPHSSVVVRTILPKLRPDCMRACADSADSRGYTCIPLSIALALELKHYGILNLLEILWHIRAATYMKH